VHQAQGVQVLHAGHDVQQRAVYAQLRRKRHDIRVLIDFLVRLSGKN